jgi:uncharacterized protein (DUF1800 family)
VALLPLASGKPKILDMKPLATHTRLNRRQTLLLAAGTAASGSVFAVPATHAGTAPADALHVLNRLSYGPTGGEVARVMQIGVDRYIAEQLNPEGVALPPALTQQIAALQVGQRSQRDLVMGYRELQRDAARDQSEAAKAKRREMVQSINLESGQARVWQATQSPRQLNEVMVDFWFNHFNVFSGKGLDRVLVESYERQAIRPYAMGRFRDLLVATAHHPAMLFYLDNWLSVAPGYVPRGRAGAGGAQRPTGLNENYARELMELHTLGVDGGYTQADVTQLARMLTGWTLNPRARSFGGNDSLFFFDPQRHDGGEKQWLGHRVAPHGQAEGEWALELLAAHPSTARHISRKLAQYFVSDVPPQPLVDRLARRFTESGGDIRAVLQTLFDSPEFRDPSVHNAKFKTPYQYLVSAVRACGVQVANVRPLLATAAQLGMPLYGCQTPDGYKNTEEAWLNPDAITRRISFATALGTGKLPLGPVADAGADSAPPVDAQTLLDTLGPGISAKTRDAVLQSEPRLQVALLLGSPDFMRR